MTPDPALRLVAADALVARLRARVDGWDFDDMAHQRDTLAQAGGRDPAKLPEALAAARVAIERALT